MYIPRMFDGAPCENKGTYIRDGKRYCWAHDPVGLVQRAAIRRAKWQEDWDAREAGRKAVADRDRFVRDALRFYANEEALDGGEMARTALKLLGIGE